MYCKQLSVINFKNYREASLVFSPKFNCFTGNNGSGKTNLLDAIHYLSLCKGFTNPIDTQNILFEEEMFMIQGRYQINGQEDELYCGLKRNHRKVFKRNKKEYERLSDHIGLFPLVLLSPADTQLILGGSEDRRKFLDSVISQYDKEYLYKLISYNKALLQRNTLLKQFAERRYFDAASLEIWDEQLVANGTYVFHARQDFFGTFLDVFRSHYAFLSDGNEHVDIEYLSGFSDGQEFLQLLEESRDKDRQAQYTTVGIHKDDLSFLIHGWPAKKFGSQGQQKSFIIALKLAQFSFTRDIKGFHPILLFDDIFDKLDECRVQQLMQMVSEQHFGQVFITDTHTERIESLFSNIPSECKLFVVDKGNIVGTKILNDKNSRP
jgi:DNA replication and repair protein RecF